MLKQAQEAPRDTGRFGELLLSQLPDQTVDADPPADDPQELDLLLTGSLLRLDPGEQVPHVEVQLPHLGPSGWTTR